MKTADWYFDFISPFAYLQSAKLPELERRANLRLRPVLFAALLDHHGQLGPAEIAPKRDFVFRQSLWLAQQHGIEMKLPPSHPFNPLPALRLAIALESSVDAVQAIFDFIWREGRDIGDAAEFGQLATRLGVGDAADRIAQPAVKDTLRRNGEEANARGVFGVPTLVVDDEIFWGFDATGFFLDYLEQPDAVRATLFEPVARFSQGKARRRKGPQ
jgi:2-hydroxychromene-2-carboxylate isomerase